MHDRARQHQRNVTAEWRRVRQARHRQRQRESVTIALVPFNDVIVDALVRWRFLGPDEVHSREEIGEAMSRALEQAAALNELNELLKYWRG